LIILSRDGKTIEVCGKSIKKTYEGPDRFTKLQKLKSVYDLLKEKGVPNVDGIAMSYSDCGAVVFLEPKGMSVFPRNSRQVLDAVCCVLQALIVSPFKSVHHNIIIIPLKVMHEGPKPIFHRDIRWPNIIQHTDDPKKWFLIDWDDAVIPPTFAVTHLEKDYHAPALFSDDHGAEVDVWAVGLLIAQASQTILGFPADFRVLGITLQSKTLTALEALERVKALNPISEECL
jgi:hypothetical protein